MESEDLRLWRIKHFQWFPIFMFCECRVNYKIKKMVPEFTCQNREGWAPEKRMRQHLFNYLYTHAYGFANSTSSCKECRQKSSFCNTLKFAIKGVLSHQLLQIPFVTRPRTNAITDIYYYGWNTSWYSNKYISLWAWGLAAIIYYKKMNYCTLHGHVVMLLISQLKEMGNIKVKA